MGGGARSQKREQLCWSKKTGRCTPRLGRRSFPLPHLPVATTLTREFTGVSKPSVELAEGRDLTCRNPSPPAGRVVYPNNHGLWERQYCLGGNIEPSEADGPMHHFLLGGTWCSMTREDATIQTTESIYHPALDDDVAADGVKRVSNVCTVAIGKDRHLALPGTLGSPGTLGCWCGGAWQTEAGAPGTHPAQLVTDWRS